MTKGYKTGGRKKGALNKATILAEKTVRRMKIALERQEKLEKTTDKCFDAAGNLDVFQGLPDEFLCKVYADPMWSIDTRVRAATNVLPYVKPKLEAVNVYSQSGKNGEASDISRLELARRVAYLLTTAAKKQPGETLELLGNKQETVDVNTGADAAPTEAERDMPATQPKDSSNNS